MALTTAEVAQAMMHLGFAGTVSYTAAAGPIVAQLSLRTNAEHQLVNLTTDGETRVRTILGYLSAIELRMDKAIKRLAATKVGEIGIREDEEDALEKEYRRWGWRLSEAIGAEPNTYSKRYGASGICGARA